MEFPSFRWERLGSDDLLCFCFRFSFVAMNPGPTSRSLEVMEDMRYEGLRVTDCAFSGAKGAEDRLASDSFAFALFPTSHTRTHGRVRGSLAMNND